MRFRLCTTPDYIRTVPRHGQLEQLQIQPRPIQRLIHRRRKRQGRRPRVRQTHTPPTTGKPRRHHRRHRRRRQARRPHRGRGVPSPRHHRGSHRSGRHHRRANRRPGDHRGRDRRACQPHHQARRHPHHRTREPRRPSRTQRTTSTHHKRSDPFTAHSPNERQPESTLARPRCARNELDQLFTGGYLWRWSHPQRSLDRRGRRTAGPLTTGTPTAGPRQRPVRHPDAIPARRAPLPRSRSPLEDLTPETPSTGSRRPPRCPVTCCDESGNPPVDRRLEGPGSSGTHATKVDRSVRPSGRAERRFQGS